VMALQGVIDFPQSKKAAGAASSRGKSQSHESKDQKSSVKRFVTSEILN
jgi:hypothetical protein